MTTLPMSPASTTSSTPMPTLIDARWREVRRVLAVRLDNLGDMLVTTPALHAIKQSLPQATLTLLVSPVGAQVVRLNPDVDEVIVYEAPWMDPWHKLPLDSAREQRMIEQLRRSHFDGAIIFTSYHQSPLPAAYMCYLADIPLRVAASIDGPGSLLTTRHKHPERMMHEVERGLDLVAAIGLGTEERDLVLRVPEAARANVGDVLSWIISRQATGDTSVAPTVVSNRRVGARHASSEPGVADDGGYAPGVGATLVSPAAPTLSQPFVVVHPGCTMPARTYPEEMYSDVIELLVRRLGARVAVTGAPDERELVARVVARVSEDVRQSVTPLAGALPFAEFCALIEAANLTITNNTGPMHIAAALKTPVVALFALTNPPEQWGPWHVPHRQLYAEVACRICYSRVCPYGHECLRLVSPEMVVEAARELLATEVAPEGLRPQSPPARAADGAKDRWPQRPPTRAANEARKGVGARHASPVRPAAETALEGSGRHRRLGVNHASSENAPTQTGIGARLVLPRDVPTQTSVGARHASPVRRPSPHSATGHSATGHSATGKRGSR